MPSILLVDDDQDILESLTRILSRKGYQVEAALTGADALVIARHKAPAVALIDLRLQEMSGLELMGQIKECCPGIQTIIGTGHTSKAAAIEATNLGAFAYVEKPYDIEHLLVTLRRAAEKQEAEETIAFQATLLQNISDAVVATDRESRIRSWNRAAERIYGWRAEEVIGLPLEQVLQPDLPEGRRQEIRELLLEEKVWKGELTQKHRDGRAIPMMTSVTLLQDREGKPSGIVAINHDITSRVQMENALQASEERYRLFLNNFQGIAYQASALTFKLSFFHGAVAEITGYTEEDFVSGRVRWDELIHPDDIQAVMEEGQRLVTLPGHVADNEYRIIPKSGMVRWVNDLASTVRGHGDDRGVIQGTIYDVTERRQAEDQRDASLRALEDSEERFRQTIQQMPYPVEVCDADGTARVVNQAFLDMFQIPSADLVVDHYNVFDDPVTAQLDLTEDIRRVYRGETVFVPRIALPLSQLTDDYGASSPDAIIYQDVTMFPVFRESGEVWQVVTIWKDITDRVQAEEERERLLAEVRTQAGRIQQIMDTVPQGVLLISVDGRIILANPTAEQFLLLLANARPGDTLTHLGERPLAELLTSPQEGLWHEVTAKGSTFELIGRPTETAVEGEQWVIVIRDVTREREAEQRIQQQERLAAVGQLAAGIAHDFNNIMATVILYAQLSARDEELSERNRRRMETICQQALHASNLIQQILDFTRRTVLDRRILDLVPLLKDQVQLLRRTLPENIAVKMAYGADEYTISGDLTRMRQVIVNLALNARDAMPEGGELRIDLARVSYESQDVTPVREMPAGEWVRVTVSDSGTGIPADTLPHIFDPFFTTKAPGEGTGLGLAQVHGIIGSHQGFIDVQTEIGNGTTFAIYLPALTAGRADAAELGIDSLVTGDGETILLVEDNQDARSALAESLKLMKYQVVETANGREALEVLDQRADEIALVLSDVVMPEMSGTTLLQAMRARKLNVPIVMLTGHMLGHELESLRARGIADWIPKPPNLEQLSLVIARALDTTRSAEAKADQVPIAEKRQEQDCQDDHQR
jgi:two-component system cell cycle sensor histidine kinase/response regulator CckA